MIFLDGVAKNKELSANSQSIGSWELKYGVRRPDMQNKRPAQVMKSHTPGDTPV